MRKVLLTVTVAVALTGCASSTHHVASVVSPSPSVTPGLGVPTAGSKAQKLADTLVTKADLPAGWTSAPSQPDLSYGPENDKEAAACFGYPYTPIVQRAYGPDFTSPDGATTTVEVDQYEPAGFDAMAKLMDDAVAEVRCTKANLEGPLAKTALGLVGATATASSVTTSAGLVTVEAKLTATMAGKPFTLYFDQTLAIVKPFSLVVETYSQSPIGASTRDAFLGLLQSRLSTVSG